MPKKPPRNNPKARELRTVHTAGDSAAALLQRISRRAQVVLPGGGGAGGAPSWLSRLQAALPAEQRPHLVEVLEKEGALLLFVDTAAWAARVRLSLPDLAAAMEGRQLEVRLATQKRQRPGPAAAKKAAKDQ